MHSPVQVAAHHASLIFALATALIVPFAARVYAQKQNVPLLRAFMARVEALPNIAAHIKVCRLLFLLLLLLFTWSVLPIDFFGACWPQVASGCS
jgi:hypothetical protein